MCSCWRNNPFSRLKLRKFLALIQTDFEFHLPVVITLYLYDVKVEPGSENIKSQRCYFHLKALLVLNETYQRDTEMLKKGKITGMLFHVVEASVWFCELLVTIYVSQSNWTCR